jgi:hypothetical protein
MLPPMDEQVKLAFEFAKGLSEQLITLSTGIVALSVTFTKDIVARGPSGRTRVILGVAWLFFIVSVICGLDHLMALTGELVPKPKTVVTDSAGEVQPPPLPPRVTGIGSGARGAMARQLITFIIATALMLVYGYLSLRPKNAPRQKIASVDDADYNPS